MALFLVKTIFFMAENASFQQVSFDTSEENQLRAVGRHENPGVPVVIRWA